MTFGAVKNYTVGKSAPGYFSPPDRIVKIRRGAYHEFVGFSVNNGLADWTAFDFEKKEAIKIACYSGDKLGFAPKEIPPGSSRIVKEVSGHKLIEMTTILTLDESQLGRLVGYANELWESPPDFPSPATDIHHAIVLLDGETKKVIGGPGLLPAGPAESLGQELNAIFTSSEITD